MLDHPAAHWPPILKNLSTRTRRCAIGAVIVTPLLLVGVLSSVHPGSVYPGAAADSGLAGCTSLSSTHHVAIDYPKIRAQFAGSRWPDLRTAGTAYVDLAIKLRTARGTDGYETVWFYQRLGAACAKYGRTLNAST
jgi:hypothetical protein